MVWPLVNWKTWLLILEERKKKPINCIVGFKRIFPFGFFFETSISKNLALLWNPLNFSNNALTMLWSMVHNVYNQNFHRCFVWFYKKFMLDFQFQPCTYKHSNNGWCLYWPRREDGILHKPNQNKMLQLGLLASPQSTCKMILSKHFHTNKPPC